MKTNTLSNLNVPQSVIDKMAHFMGDCILNNAHRFGVRMSYSYSNQRESLKTAYVDAVAAIRTYFASNETQKNVFLELLWCSKWKAANDQLKADLQLHNITADDVAKVAEHIAMNIDQYIYANHEFYLDQNHQLQKHSWL